MIKRIFAITALSILLLLNTASANEEVKEEQWLSYTPDNRIITTRIPFGFKTKAGDFIPSEDKTLQYEEIFGSFKNEQHPAQSKTYAVKYSNVLGIPISQTEATTMLTEEQRTIAEAYKPYNGVIIEKNMGMLDDSPYGEIIVEYEHDKHGTQAIRSRTIYTPNLKLKLVALGPADEMTTLRTRDFFEQFEIRDFSKKQYHDLEKEWRSIEAPHKTYTLFLPQESEFFMPGKPKTQKGKNYDRMGIVFHDPAREQHMFYNVLTYYSPQNATFQDVQYLLRARHINNRREQQSAVPFTESIVDNTAFLQANYDIPEIKGYPYARFVRLRTQFRGHYIVVQELVGSNEMITSEFADKVMSSLLFHPNETTIKAN